MIPNRVDWLLLAPAGLALGVAAWNVVAWPAIGNRRLMRRGEVSVLIPARNEAHNIAACLQAVLSQGASVGEVLVYDDGSVDDTAAVAGNFSIADPVSGC